MCVAVCICVCAGCMLRPPVPVSCFWFLYMCSMHCECCVMCAVLLCCCCCAAMLCVHGCVRWAQLKLQRAFLFRYQDQSGSGTKPRAAKPSKVRLQLKMQLQLKLPLYIESGLFAGLSVLWRQLWRGEHWLGLSTSSRRICSFCSFCFFAATACPLGLPASLQSRGARPAATTRPTTNPSLSLGSRAAAGQTQWSCCWRSGLRGDGKLVLAPPSDLVLPDLAGRIPLHRAHLAKGRRLAYGRREEGREGGREGGTCEPACSRARSMSCGEWNGTQRSTWLVFAVLCRRGQH